MSTATTDAPAALPIPRTAVDSQPITLARAVKAEWIKWRSLRSTWTVLGAAVIGMLAVGLIVAYNTRHLTGNQDANDLSSSATLQGFFLGQLLIGALGVLFVSSEFSTGMIRSTFAAVPKRLPVLCAKLVVFFVVTAVAMTTITVITFVASQALIGHYRTGFSLSDPGVWRIVLGTSLYMVLVGVIGGMIGWMVRSTPGSLVSFFALLFVLPELLSLFASTGRHIAQFLPSQAGEAFAVAQPESPHLSPGAGVLVLCAWVVAGIVAAAFSLHRRDA
ncbi:ABC-2 family transporter protein [Actinacidiphila yanglinensis]|uniref:ABC-2 family transporter protein n=1 Tax=Actinacidiphila yanglinensis TaxID=310779 RepID=A0A1H6DG85_9ACTN|nr:ABC transporter permease [Actinacidiphila yanglinensis]SEG84181.1 ABC-2 family transporter protein [Actinacidiphila yanglinensis]